MCCWPSAFSTPSIDPIIGALSDRTKSPLGRRRPWIALGVPPLIIALYLLFSPALSAEAPFCGLGWGCSSCFSPGRHLYRPLRIPRRQLTQDYDERTAILSLRDGALILGTILAAASPAIIQGVLGFGDGPDAERAKFRAVALSYAPLVVLACLACVWLVKERHGHRNSTALPSLRTLGARLKNRPFAFC